MRKLFIFLLLLLTPALAHAQGCMAEGKCVEDFKKQGWQEVARCDDGHDWSYVLEKSGAHLICTGINALSGPEDDACVPFAGTLEQYKAVVAKAQQQVNDYNTAKAEHRLDSFLRAQGKNSAQMVNCREGFMKGQP